MNFFIEGLQGSGKSTMVRKLSEFNPDYTAVREGEYSPVELSWCAYVNSDQYKEILKRYPDLRSEIEEKTHSEGNRNIICYTKIATDNRAFYQDLEQYEIYNNRVSFDDFRSIVLERYRKWDSDKMIFECSIFQNTIEDMILFRQMPDEEIMAFYRLVREALNGKEYCIIYLKADDIRANLDIIRKERSDASGNELWYPMMLGFFNDCPYSKARGLRGDNDLIDHFRHRQDLELRICEEIFPDKSIILRSKDYTDESIKQLLSVSISERKPEDMGKTERRLPTHIVAAAGIVVNGNGEILLVKNNRRGWEFPGGQVEVGENVIDAVKREIMEEAGVEIEVGEVFCISSNTCKYPGYNGIKEVPTKIMLDFICHAKKGTPRPSEENTASAFFPKDMVLELIQSPAYIERFKAFMDYMGRPIYLEYVTKPEFQLKIKRLI